MEKRVKIAAVGDNCIDFYDKTGESFPGGNPVNVAVYTVRLGGEASYIGVVGDDESGKMMRNAIKEKGVDVSHLKILPGTTAVTHVEIINGDRVFGEYEEGVMADFCLKEEDIDFIASHDMMVTGIWGKIEKDMQRIQSLGTEVAFDFSDQYESKVINEVIPYVDYAFFAYAGEDELWLKTYMKQQQAKGPKVVVVTRGERGSIAWDGIKFIEGGIVPCEVVDTMGAGDSFIAGFLRGILKGKEIKECMRMGAENSSITLGYSGAW